MDAQPTFPVVTDYLAQAWTDEPSTAPNIVPLITSIPAEFLNPSSAYLKIAAK